MHNLDEITRIYFSYTSVIGILREEIDYDSFPQKEFQRLSRAYITYYSDTENNGLYDYVEESARVEGHPYAGIRNRSGLNVFAALEELAEQILTTEDNRTLCRYSELLRFREITNYVEEDLLVCAYLVSRKGKYRESEQHTYFGWDTTIGHNNDQLRGILREGISENHFHLYGSAPIFQLTWLYYMNHVMDEGGIEQLKEIDERPRNSRNHYYVGYQEEGYERTVLKAALIRVFLFSYFMGSQWQKKISELFGNKIKDILSDKLQIENYRKEIQDAVDLLKAYYYLIKGKDSIDYALYLVEGNGREEKSGNLAFSGERWFMYKMSEAEMQGDLSNKDYYQWFYAYLVIKQNLRNEILQTNGNVGFENFSIYTKRKTLYKNANQLALTAVYSSLLSGNLRSLEVRITPGQTAMENAEWIKYVDGLLGIEDEKKRNEINTKIYYVFHFTKKADSFLKEMKEARNKSLSKFENTEVAYKGSLFCRHYKERNAWNKQANEIRNFREQYPRAAQYVLGIDACSQEIGCRPEVFAPIFRFLADHVVSDSPDAKVNQLKMSYHVGEDFLDVVDGLRAVDEAIQFLNLQCGDRIGHGTVLGIDIYKWYKFKRGTIILPQQDYLDNVAWMYHKLTEFRIPNCEGLQHYLSEQFDTYFSRIYGQYLKQDSRRYTIHAYYEAWKLRGDEPKLYISGQYKPEIQFCNRDYLINYRYPKMFESRFRAEVSELYYMYHYCYKVKDEGSKTIEVYVPPIYIEGAYRIQKAMQHYVASCGIGIETNPSSNLLISTMEGYDEHPIVQLYNKDLTYDNDKLKNCPQINVSINTDDKGVFRTSLENEYALMACALEKVRDEQGNPVYNRQMIYQWLDNIRKMGNLQSFCKDYKGDEKVHGFYS